MAKNDVTKSAKDKAKAVVSKEPKKKGGIKRYFKELKSEMKKVVWPTRKKVIPFSLARRSRIPVASRICAMLPGEA